MIVFAGILLVLGGVFFILTFIAAKDVRAINNNNNAKSVLSLGVGLSVLCIILAIISLFAVPEYHVWQQNKEGEAELARAEQNRQIAIQEARAKEESAKSLANAEVIRAEGIAQANKIIGNSLQNNDAYIHYLWIEALKESNSDVIYIPTEAGIPITESTRFFKKSEN